MSAHDSIPEAIFALFAPFAPFAPFARPALISITGGGGKTTLMRGLGRIMAERGERVILTTTTRIEADSCSLENLLVGPPSPEELERFFVRAGHRIFTVGERLEGDKIKGVNPAYLDTLFESRVADFIVAEADGAKRLPFKAYERYEPVIPSATTFQVVVAGAEILVEPPSRDNVFRCDLFEERWTHEEGRALPMDTLAGILCCDGEYLKGSVPGSKKMLLINKCDLIGADIIEKTAHSLRDRLSVYDYLVFASLETDTMFEFIRLDGGRK